MKRICLFTNEFPYGNWEPYLETEIEYYEKFDDIKIFSLQLREEHAKHCRNLGNDKIQVFPVYKVSNLIYILYAFVALFDKNLHREIRKLISEKKFTFRRLVQLFVFISRSHYEAKKIIRIFSKEELENSIFYSYRFEYQPYVSYLIKTKLGLDSKIVARAHGFDLYEENRPSKYIPLREILLEKIDYVFPCSDYGTNYLKEKFPDYEEKISTRFLGSLDHGIQNYKKSSKLRLLSCSTVLPVKRLEIIVDALSNIDDIKIIWTHFGDGADMKKIKTLANKLPSNIDTIFKGNIPNSTLLEEYKNKSYDWFVNVSSSEGIPVSIMEAMSFGIPAIATDVGGTSEIVNDKNGFLLNSNLSGNKLAKVFRRVYAMDINDYLNYRQEARETWDNKYNSAKNYKKFTDELIKMIN